MKTRKEAIAEPPPPTPRAWLLKARHSPIQPDVWRVELADGTRVVWKTFERAPLIVRATLGAWITKREARNLRLLMGIPNVPRFVRLVHPWTLEMSFLQAEPVPETKRSLSPEYFLALEKMVNEIHARGVNHGDLRKKNLMRHPVTGAPCLVDFAQSMSDPDKGSLFARVVLERAFRVDRLKVLKLKRWYLGAGAIPAEEQQELDAVPFHLRVGRFLRQRVYLPLKHLLRGGRRPAASEHPK